MEQSLDRLLARHCAPALLGVKPANLIGWAWPRSPICGLQAQKGSLPLRRRKIDGPEFSG